MVPGMTERDRRIADMQRLEWLADARFGPARRPVASHWQREEVVPRRVRRRDPWWRHLLAALSPGRRVRPRQPMTLDTGGRALESMLG